MNEENSKGIIYYTDSRLLEPVSSVVRKFISDSGLPIVSCSLNKPLDFGKNIVYEGSRGYCAMMNQIKIALENLDTKYVFFCEHDVLYHSSHWKFCPKEDDVFYYNINNWRFWAPGGWAITYDELHSLSGMCCNREFALDHYKRRIAKMEELGLDQFRSREPRMARKWSYEPGTKQKRRGGFSDDKFETWKSELPNVDIRHTRTFSSPKINLSDFKHPPTNWQQIDYKDIPGWDLDAIFDLQNMPLPFSLLSKR